MSGRFVEREIRHKHKRTYFLVAVILPFYSFVLLSHKMSFCYCMGGFQSKKTAFSFYLTGQKRVNRSIQSIFLYIYMVYALLFCIFSAYMQFNLKRMTNHSAESGKSFSAEKTENNKNNNFERLQTPEKSHENALETPI